MTLDRIDMSLKEQGLDIILSSTIKGADWKEIKQKMTYADILIMYPAENVIRVYGKRMEEKK